MAWDHFARSASGKRGELAFENERKTYHGGNPIADKIATKTARRIPTFSEAAQATLEANRAKWKSAKVEKNWTQQMARHAMPVLGSLRLDAIGREEVLKVLTPIWAKKSETARRVRRHIKSVLEWGIAHGHLSTNPAGSGIDGALPRMASVKAHHRALAYAELADALATIEGYDKASAATKLALRLLVFTAARSGEVRGARWDEIDLEKRTWRIPASRMKGGREHRVPLCDQAMKVLEQVARLRDESGLVFPSPRKAGAPLSDMALTKLLRDACLADRTTVHGLRSTFRDWCAETGKPREIAEAALAHTVQGVEGAYFRSDLFKRRRQLMAAWDRYLSGRARQKVVSITG